MSTDDAAGSGSVLARASPISAQAIARDRLGAIGLAIGAVACATGGPVGVLLGVGVVIAGGIATPLAAFALGQVGLLVALESVGGAFAIGQLGLLAVVTDPLRQAVAGATQPPRSSAGSAVAAAVLGATAVVWMLTPRAVWLAAVATVGLTGLAIYAVHRYGIVRLGLTPVSTSTDTDPTTMEYPERSRSDTTASTSTSPTEPGAGPGQTGATDADTTAAENSGQEEPR